jgi:hypothetical protein
MSFLPTSRTKRNLIKVASLGLAGLLAGLLAGCNSADASIRTSRTHSATDSLSPDGYATQPTDLPKSIEATQIPALRHPPSARRVGSAHTISQTAAPYGPSGY